MLITPANPSPKEWVIRLGRYCPPGKGGVPCIFLQILHTVNCGTEEKGMCYYMYQVILWGNQVGKSLRKSQRVLHTTSGSSDQSDHNYFCFWPMYLGKTSAYQAPGRKGIIHDLVSVPKESICFQSFWIQKRTEKLGKLCSQPGREEVHQN